MEKYEIYEIEASSFEGRLPLMHRFELPGKNETDVLVAINNRWPEFYDIKITVKHNQSRGRDD